MSTMRFRSNSLLYEKVSEGEDGADIPLDKSAIPTSSGRRKECWIFTPLGTILVAVLTAVVTAFVSTSIVSLRHARQTAGSSATNATSLINTTLPTSGTEHAAEIAADIKGCGSNAAEARALGCVYDVMMQDWTPVECYDSILTEKYLATNNWTWWADAGAERAMSDEEVALGEHNVVYVAQDYHVKHCIFAWEKFVRAFRTQSPLITELISYDHVLHCRDHTLLPALDPTKHIRGVVAPTGFTHCASYDTWINALPENQHSSID